MTLDFCHLCLYLKSRMYDLDNGCNSAEFKKKLLTQLTQYADKELPLSTVLAITVIIIVIKEDFLTSKLVLVFVQF